VTKSWTKSCHLFYRFHSWKLYNFSSLLIDTEYVSFIWTRVQIWYSETCINLTLKENIILYKPNFKWSPGVGNPCHINLYKWNTGLLWTQKLVGTMFDLDRFHSTGLHWGVDTCVILLQYNKPEAHRNFYHLPGLLTPMMCII